VEVCAMGNVSPKIRESKPSKKRRKLKEKIELNPPPYEVPNQPLVESFPTKTNKKIHPSDLTPCTFYLNVLRYNRDITGFPREIDVSIVSLIFQLKREKAFKEYRRENFEVAFELLNFEDHRNNGIVCYKNCLHAFSWKGRETRY